jgi:hypothetical protein
MIDVGSEQGQDTVGKVATFMVCGRFLLESAKNQFIEVDPPPRTTCSTMCSVWNDMLTN